VSPAAQEPAVLIAERAVPELGIQAGERVVVRPGTQYPVVIQRDVPPNYTSLRSALEAGELRPLTANAAALLRSAQGGPHLELVRRSPASPEPEGDAA